MMRTLFFTAVAIFVIYITASIIKNKGIPKSISNTYYIWKESKLGILFTIFMSSCGLLLLMSWQYISPTPYEFLCFLSCSGMVFVGGACAYEEELTKEVHYGSAGVWAGCSIVWNIIMGNFEIILGSLLIGLICWFWNSWKEKGFINITFWLEIACVISILAGVGRYYL